MFDARHSESTSLETAIAISTLNIDNLRIAIRISVLHWVWVAMIAPSCPTRSTPAAVPDLLSTGSAGCAGTREVVFDVDREIGFLWTHVALGLDRDGGDAFERGQLIDQQ